MRINQPCILLGSMLAFLLIACQEKTPSQHLPSDHVQANHLPADSQAKTTLFRLVSVTDQALLAPYFQMQASLVEGNVAGAQKAALLLEEAALQIAKRKELAEVAGKILREKDLEKQRSYFSALSRLMIEVVEKGGVAEGRIHVAECPMALNDQGASWLTLEDKVINPYFGSAMLNCGSIEKTINK